MITATFLASSLVVIMIPGPDLALITRLVLRYRRVRPAVAAAAGMITAGALQVALGMLGLAVLFAARPDVFAVVRWVGAAVLLGWAALALRSALRPAEAESEPPELPARGAFLQGLLCTGSNPKVGIFLIAFLPQFVPAGVAPVPGIAVLASLYLAIGLVWLLVWMHLVHRLGRVLQSPRAMRAAHTLTAVVFAAFAFRILWVH